MGYSFTSFNAAPDCNAQPSITMPADRCGPCPTSVLNVVTWRAFDILVASAMLIAVLPFLLLLALLLYVSDRGPLFFVHRRVGYQGRYFDCIKFRTMKVNADALLQSHLRESPTARKEWEDTQKVKDDPRVTKVGAIVRKFSLDEFPQLINVLRGEMSIVGPRPIVEAEVIRYGQYFNYYCAVKPGLTGLWQTSGRNDTTYARRVELDVDYVTRKSISLDTWLLLKTVPAVVLANGSY